MAVSQDNRFRYRQILIARQVKWLFMAVPERFAMHLLGRFLLGPLLRWLFLAADGEPHRAGEVVLAELRRRGGLERFSIFDPDPHVLAYREGQRAVVREIFNLLHLDEGRVQNLMEIDDGLGSE